MLDELSKSKQDDLRLGIGSERDGEEEEREGNEN